MMGGADSRATQKTVYNPESAERHHILCLCELIYQTILLWVDLNAHLNAFLCGFMQFSFVGCTALKLSFSVVDISFQGL